MVITPDGDEIIESFGDFGTDDGAAINRNLTNFSMGDLHVLLAAFSADSNDILKQITIENWEINNKRWTAYIGNLIPKTNIATPCLLPPNKFYDAITAA